MPVHDRGSHGKLGMVVREPNSHSMDIHTRAQGIARVTAVVLAVAISLAGLDAALARSSAEPIGARHGKSWESSAAPVLQFQEEAQPQNVTPDAATPIAPIGLLSPTVLVTPTITVTPVLTATPSDAPPISATVTVTTQTPEGGETAAPPETQAATPDEAAAETTNASQNDTPAPVEAGPLQGTIVTNRTNYAARFFLEGQVYRLEPFASTELEVPRVTAVLNLFSCDASAPDNQSGCYWDPYIVEQDGFYELVDESSVVGLPSLILRNANQPPEDQVWIHNRTGITESVVLRDTVYDIPPGAVQEFGVEVGAPVILYVRSCGELQENQVCEWSPQSLDPGGYFAMVEVSTPGGIPGSRITAVDVRPVVDASGDAVATPVELTCQLRVPAINIRSGPGLQYQIVGKIREQANEPARVAVTGRSADGLWFAVAESVSPNGWVTSNPDFMTCRGSTDSLPLAEFTGAPLVPTPVPTAAAAEIVEDAAPVAEARAEDEPAVSVSETVTPTEQAPDTTIPEGLSMLVVNNGFQHPIRFTVDQTYRPIEGPSEYDLEPGATTNVVVFPGTVAFTASSPWNGLSGNAVLETEADQSSVLWLRFEPDPNGSSNWELAWD